MSDRTKLVPASVQLAAKRAALRTTLQGYATALASGISATALIAWVNGGPDVTATLITVAVTVLSPLLAGAASYASIVSRGIPAEYAPVTTQTGDVVTMGREEITPAEAVQAVDPTVTPDGTGAHRATD